MWKKKKLLVTSNFSFFHCVFKRLVLQTRRNQVLFGKESNKMQVPKKFFRENSLQLSCHAIGLSSVRCRFEPCPVLQISKYFYGLIVVYPYSHLLLFLHSQTFSTVVISFNDTQTYGHNL